MPLFFHQEVNSDTKLAVWQIAEEEAFFRQHAIPQRSVLHPHKRLQHLAGRYLLRFLFPFFPTELIRIADTRKPYLQDEAFHFSISHCSQFAAAIVSSSQRVGVDIEVITEKASRIRHKFASEREWELVNRHCSMMHTEWNKDNGKEQSPGYSIDALAATLIWSCKEAVFKWYGTGEVDFKKHIALVECQVENKTLRTTVLFKKEDTIQLQLRSFLLGELWLSYVIA